MISEVHHIDCMEYMRTLPDKFFELAIVDPPYGLGESVVNSGGRFARYENKNGNWDLEIPNATYFNELFRVSKNQIIWGGNYFIDNLYSTKCFIIWDKRQPQGVSFASCEFAWSSFDKVSKTFYMRPQGQEDRWHPTMKPIALYRWLLENYAKPGDKIFDSHMGSQSSRIAAWQLGFDYYGCELDKDYFDAGCKRFEAEKSKGSLFTPDQLRTETKPSTLF